MADRFLKAKRSAIMASVPRSGTRPELMVRKRLHAAGFRFRSNVAGLPGRPDIVLLRYRAVVFVNGCFWHQHPNCRLSALPKSNRRFWREKLTENVRRDRRSARLLRMQGWRVFTVWSCSTNERRISRLTREI